MVAIYALVILAPKLFSSHPRGRVGSEMFALLVSATLLFVLPYWTDSVSSWLLALPTVLTCRTSNYKPTWPVVLVSLAAGGGRVLAGDGLLEVASTAIFLLAVGLPIGGTSEDNDETVQNLREELARASRVITQSKATTEGLNAAVQQLAEESRTKMALQSENAELKQQVDETRAQVDKALEEKRYKSSFLANMSHELRTPLNAIIGLTELGLMADELQEEVRRDMEVVLQSAHHLLRLVEEVLDMSKIEAGKMKLIYELFPIGDLLEQISRTATALTLQKSVVFKVSYSRLIGKMRCDRTKLFQILTNLVANACKFTGEGRVELRASMRMNDGVPWIVFEVEDTGIGIAEDQFERLFLPFTQTDESSTRAHGGSGLGLALVKHFCEMLGGQVAVTSELGKGSTFTVSLPREPQNLKLEGAMMISVH